MAFDRGEPCPYCGLSAQAALEVAMVRDRRGDEQLKEQLSEAIVRTSRAEELNGQLLGFARSVRAELDRIIKAAEEKRP
jgi:hypothetical protein